MDTILFQPNGGFEEDGDVAAGDHCQVVLGPLSALCRLGDLVTSALRWQLQSWLHHCRVVLPLTSDWQEESDLSFWQSSLCCSCSSNTRLQLLCSCLNQLDQDTIYFRDFAKPSLLWSLYSPYPKRGQVEVLFEDTRVLCPVFDDASFALEKLSCQDKNMGIEVLLGCWL